ncbi:hypothetical protein BT96DRAFT_946431 [Gymnopus androsaceus JB14]|uniref:RING-type E3 ubiquitin transferase n=1 Tax=Gymnopus androsaceus JB14 TaxID=1447944 RepID=A0A6A4GW15_9AGAR|nr:hypothetical protein BT96DRAFT_946431 [Gymnopus androsaceus JB14]
MFKFAPPVYAADMPSTLPSLLMTRWLLEQGFYTLLIILRAIVVSVVWLALVPLFTVFSWRVYFSTGDSIALWISGHRSLEESRPSSHRLLIGQIIDLTRSFVNKFGSSPVHTSVYNLLGRIGRHPACVSLSADIFAGQIIAALAIFTFVTVFLLRAWIAQTGFVNNQENVGQEILQVLPGPQVPRPAPRNARLALANREAIRTLEEEELRARTLGRSAVEFAPVRSDTLEQELDRFASMRARRRKREGKEKKADADGEIEEENNRDIKQERMQSRKFAKRLQLVKSQAVKRRIQNPGIALPSPPPETCSSSTPMPPPQASFFPTVALEQHNGNVNIPFCFLSPPPNDSASSAFLSSAPILPTPGLVTSSELPTPTSAAFNTNISGPGTLIRRPLLLTTLPSTFGSPSSGPSLLPAKTPLASPSFATYRADYFASSSTGTPSATGEQTAGEEGEEDSEMVDHQEENGDSEMLDGHEKQRRFTEEDIPQKDYALPAPPPPLEPQVMHRVLQEDDVAFGAEDDNDDGKDEAVEGPQRPRQGQFIPMQLQLNGPQPQPQPPARNVAEEEALMMDNREAAVEDNMERAMEGKFIDILVPLIFNVGSAIGLRGRVFRSLYKTLGFMIFITGYLKAKTIALHSAPPIRAIRIVTDPAVDSLAYLITDILIPPALQFVKTLGQWFIQLSFWIVSESLGEVWGNNVRESCFALIVESVSDPLFLSQMLFHFWATRNPSFLLWDERCSKDMRKLGEVWIQLAVGDRAPRPWHVFELLTVGTIISSTVRQYLLVLKRSGFFPSASYLSRMEFFYYAPLKTIFCHWVAGTMFHVLFALLLSGCRSIMRPGAMWFINQGRNAHPIHDILDRPWLVQLRKICVNAVMFSFVIIEPLSNVPIDLLFLDLALPYTMTYFHPRQPLKRFTMVIWKGLAKRLRLSSCLFGKRHGAEEYTPKRWSLSLSHVVHGPRQSSSVLASDYDGSFKRVPNTDKIALPREMCATAAVKATGEPIDDTARLLIAHQDAETIKANRNVKNDFTMVYIPPQFRWCTEGFWDSLRWLVIKRGLVWRFKAPYLTVFWGIMIPLLIGGVVVVEAYIVLLFRLHLNQDLDIPMMRVLDCWAIQRSCSVAATKDVYVPATAGLLGIIILPAVVFYSVNLSFPFVSHHVDENFLCMFCLAGLMHTFIFLRGMLASRSLFLQGMLASWSQAVRDEEFLVEMRLMNHEPTKKAAEFKTAPMHGPV